MVRNYVKVEDRKRRGLRHHKTYHINPETGRREAGRPMGATPKVNPAKPISHEVEVTSSSPMGMMHTYDEETSSLTVATPVHLIVPSTETAVSTTVMEQQEQLVSDLAYIVNLETARLIDASTKGPLTREDSKTLSELILNAKSLSQTCLNIAEQHSTRNIRQLSQSLNSIAKRK